MQTTRKTLLARVKDRADAEAWRQFHELYAPLIYRYARRKGLLRDDAEEIRDQCMAVVVERIGGFEYDAARGGFKRWLYGIALHKVADLYGRRRERNLDSAAMGELQDDGPTPDEVWEQSWRQEHLKYGIELARGSFGDRDYKAFCMLLFDDATVYDVCSALEMNPNQVYIAKSRVLKAVREKLAELDPPDRPS